MTTTSSTSATTTPARTVALDPSLPRQLAEDGVVHIPGALCARTLELAQAAFEWSIAHPSASANRYRGGEGLSYQDLVNPDAHDTYRELVHNTDCADVIAALWQSPDVWFMYEQIFLKEGGETRRTPWHQDTSYLPVVGEQLAVMWISFDAVPKADALEFVRGSHHGTRYDGSRFDPTDDTAPLYGDGSLPRLPNIEADRARWDIVSWDVVPGDVLVFHPATLHGGAATHPDTRRRTLSLRFFGGDATYAPRPGARAPKNRPPRTVFEALPLTLHAGDAYRHPDFPKLRG